MEHRDVHPEMDTQLRDRVRRLLQFLRELVVARGAVTRDVEAHPGLVWLEEYNEAVPDFGDDAPALNAGPDRHREIMRVSPDGKRFPELARIGQRLAARPESLELVLALGLVELDGVRVHVMTAPALLERDDDDFVVRLQDTAPRLEDTELLIGVPGFTPQTDRTLDPAVRILDDEAEEYLRRWLADSFDRRGMHVKPTLTRAPALLLRNRNVSALRDYYDHMIATLADSEVPIPLGLAQLVDPIEAPERLAWLRRSGAKASAELISDPLFPLPTNVEQRDVLEQLGHDSGVVVEGPPGTGKTHTIANLVSALLARGQRVLVTSEKAQALRVLRDKLPPELQELCVSITDLGSAGSAELDQSIATMALRKSTHHPGAAAAEIVDLAGKRDQAIRVRDEVLSRIEAFRRAETVDHGQVAEGYGGTAAAIVRAVGKRAGEFNWLPGPLLTATPPLDPREFERLLALLRSGSASRTARLRQNLPPVDQVLPADGSAQRACNRVSQAPSGGFGEAENDNPASVALLKELRGIESTRLIAIREHCDRLKVAVVGVRDLDPLLQDIADNVLSGKTTHLWSRVAVLGDLIAAAIEADRRVGSAQVAVPQINQAIRTAYEQWAGALASGEQFHGRFRKSDMQRHIESFGPVALVDGQPAVTAHTARVVADHLTAFDSVHRACAIVNDMGIPVFVSGTRAMQINTIMTVHDAMKAVGELVDARHALVRQLTAISPSGPRLRSIAEAAQVADATSEVAAEHDAVLARSELATIAENVAAIVDLGPSEEGDALIAALRDADGEALQYAIRAWNNARTEQAELSALDLLLLRLRTAAPELAEMLADIPTHKTWGDRLRIMGEAWQWRRAAQWITEHSDPLAYVRLDSELDRAEADVDQLTGRYAAALAWSECLDHMTAAQVQALQAYRDHMSSVGKGSGRHAERFRVAARSAMAEAQQAVPAWVMPLQQVLASIPPQQNSFDVVIVDEASQAEVTNLFLLWLAPRVIIVGDDKQCAPSEVASGSLDEVLARLDTHLPDLPVYLRDGLTPRSSMFSLLRSRFGQIIRLREHYRSMPEIIGWSSEQFYGDSPLIPIRQFGGDRLPPLRTSFVDGARATGLGSALVNKAEADAVVDTVVSMLSDAAYDGRTIGVVVLQGHAQVELIEAALLERVSTEEWNTRRLRVGNAPDFQGDERDVVLLSMVVTAPPDSADMDPDMRPPRALTRTEHQRRFNVAASRAKDQLWLFHSVEPAQLSTKDLRRSLLEYLHETVAMPVEPMPQGVPDSQRVVPFDSLFEQRVFCELAQRGFHANPKVRVNNRRIDMVVTGSSARMAVECDGDGYLIGAEQLAADIRSETELKRCGWRFYRVRESEYLLDPKRAMAGLWESLAISGIEPRYVDTTSESEA